VSTAGVGLGLRWDFLEDVLERIEGGAAGALAPLSFFEVSPENYMRRGGYYPAALERVAARFPLVAHGLTLSLGSRDPFDLAYLGELRAFLGRLEVSIYSDHLCFSGDGGRLVHELLPLPLTTASAVHAAERLREVSGRLERAVAVENVTHYLIPGAAALDEADFIAEVLERADACLLLDVNNVVVNGKNYGFDARRFMERLPLSRVVEVHVAGHEWSEEDGLFLDSHGAPVDDPVFAHLEWLVERTGPVPVLLERDHQVPPLDTLLEEATRVDAAYRRGLSRRAVGAPALGASHG